MITTPMTIEPRNTSLHIQYIYTHTILNIWILNIYMICIFIFINKKNYSARCMGDEKQYTNEIKCTIYGVGFLPCSVYIYLYLYNNNNNNRNLRFFSWSVSFFFLYFVVFIFIIIILFDYNVCCVVAASAWHRQRQIATQIFTWWYELIWLWYTISHWQ